MYRPSITISLCLLLISLNFILITLGDCRRFNSLVSTEDGAIGDDDVQDGRYSSRENNSHKRLTGAKFGRPTESDKSSEAAASSEEDSSNQEDGNDDEDDVKAADNADSLPTKASCQGASCQFQSVCGKAPLNRRTRTRSWMEPYMANGEPVEKYGEWPSYALLKIYNPVIRKNTLCGGTLVSDRHILTAAHCMYGPPKNTKTSPENITVVLGDHTIHQMDEQEKHFKVSSICVARGFSTDNDVLEIIHDYAVLTLTDRVQFSNYYQPACLPHATNIDTRRDQCYLIGAGMVDFRGGKARVINQMRVRSESCTKEYGGDGFGHIDRYRECYGKFNGKGTPCGGDSGGPVLCLDPRTKRWTVMATVSYGKIFCDSSGLFSTTAVYTRITTMLPAISAECGI